MAVQKNRKTRAKRGMRRAHDKLMPPNLSEDETTGIRHRRHHINEEGFYRGEQVIQAPTVDDEAPEEEEP